MSRDVSQTDIALSETGEGPHVPGDPFSARVRKLIALWVEHEWSERQRLHSQVATNGRKEAIRDAERRAMLSVESLAQRLDNISESKLRRELKRVGLPSPGDLIREARLDFAARLLVETRLLVQEVAARAGYDSEKHFADQFRRRHGVRPSTYRRNQMGPTPP